VRLRAPLLSALLLFVAVPATAGAVSAHNFAVAFPSYRATDGKTHIAPPKSITAGPDGNVWVTFLTANVIWRFTPSGTVTSFTGAFRTPVGITSGPGGNLWFTSLATNQIGRMTPAGEVTMFPGDTTTLASPAAIAAGTDGNVWFLEDPSFGEPGSVGRLTPGGEVTQFPVGMQLALQDGITAGPDGNVWFLTGQTVDRITPDGVLSALKSPDGSGVLDGPIVTGPDGNLWFSHASFADSSGAASHWIVQMTPQGVTKSFSYPSGYVNSLTVGPDGNLWAVTTSPSLLLRITTSGEITAFTPDAVGLQGSPTLITSIPGGALWLAETSGIAELTDVDDVGNATGFPTTASSPGAVVPIVQAPTASRVTATKLKLSPKSFRAAPSGTSGSLTSAETGKSGTTARFTLSATASVTFTVTATRTGRRSHGRCATPTRTTRGGRPCTRTVTMPGSFTRGAAAGVNTMRFSGRVGSQKLKPRRYRLVVTPLAAHATPTSAAFTIVR
jgi:streptogramin lyase